MKYLFYSVIMVMMISLFGCVKVLNDELETKETKLVLNAAIAPDSVFTVNVSRTFNIFADESNKNLPFVNDAKVRLFEDGAYVADMVSIGYGYYINPGYYPQTGKEYKVEVIHDGYQFINGSTVIPTAVDIDDFDTTQFTYIDPYNGGKNIEYIGMVKYKDPPDVKNFYQLSCRLWIKDDNGNVYWYDQAIWSLENDYQFFDAHYEGTLVWDDKYIDGKETTIRFTFYSNYIYEGLKNRNTQTVHFIFYLKSITENYFTYIKTADLFWESGGGEDPFAEPVVIYSNIENGYGIMGGYNSDTAVLNITFGDGEGGAK
jgi:hypothetical protein